MEDPAAATESDTENGTKIPNLEQAQETGANDSSSLSADELTKLVQLVKNCTVLSDLTPEMWTKDHENQISNFLTTTSHQLLLVYIDQQSGLSLCNTVPSNAVNQLAYFIKCGRTVKADSFHKAFQFGSVQGSHADTLLRIMQGLYAPAFFGNTIWPDSLRNDFSSQLHRVMAHLTDAQHKTVGHTVLYIPDEGPCMDSPDAFKDKELVLRLEVVVIHWTRQIKEVLNGQESLEMTEGAGPLEEIQFWKARCDDLSGLTRQLGQAGVGRVVSIVEKAKSSYLPPFTKLSKQIQDSLAKAENCLRFISTLSGPCTELAAAEPKAIPPLLPKLLNTVRVIWMNSEHYKSKDRLNGLLRKISSEIIKRCCQKVSLDDLFDGYVERSKLVLQESIDCCHAWKGIYKEISALHTSYSTVEWVLDESSIFAHVDAFIQRCKDLLEVAEGQVHFSRWSEGKKRPMPCFGGCKGPEITRGLKEIEHTFDRHIATLKGIRKTILDIKCTSWHDDHNRFRTGVKDLEVMLQNVINSAFSTVGTVQEGVELLEIFCPLTTRESIKRVVDQKTVELFSMFNEDLNMVKEEFNRQNPKLTSSMPRFAGKATWATALKRRVEGPMKVLENAYFLYEKGIGEESNYQFLHLVQSLEEFIGKTFNEWVATVEKELLKHLETPLLARSTHKSGMLELKFSKTLLKLFREMRYWERLRFEVPHYAADIYGHCEDLRVLRENVCLVVRDYNSIISSLLPHELALFKERIRSLDKKVQPGMSSKLTWASEGIQEYFVTDCRNHALKLFKIIHNYKMSNRLIGEHCRAISECLLVKHEEKRLYEGNEFEVEQKRYRDRAKQEIESIHQEVVATMRKTFEMFQGDTGDIQSHWVGYLDKIDGMVEEALKMNIRASLQSISREVNGDGKTLPDPLFKVKITLSETKIDFSPSIEEVANCMGGVCVDVTECVTAFQHLHDTFKLKSQKKPLSIVMAEDEEIKKIKTSVNAGVEKVSSDLKEYIKQWDKYGPIYASQKDAFFRRWRAQDATVGDYDMSLSYYSEISTQVQEMDTIINLGFILLDCSPLKYSIVAHCNEWLNRFHDVLLDTASKKLSDICTFIAENTAKLETDPETLTDLSNSLNLLERIQTSDVPSIESQFKPLNDQFNMLHQHEVMVSEAVETQHKTLQSSWTSFQQCLVNADSRLKKHKEKFRTGLLHSAEDFKKTITHLSEEFETKGPFKAEVSIPEAFEFIERMRTQLNALKTQENEIRMGLNIFKIDQPPSHVILLLEKDLDHLEQIWGLAKEWQTSWDTWKVGTFKSLATEEMGLQAQTMLKNLNKVSREVKEKTDWTICGYLKERIETFKRTMPLIQDLKNPAMRERHWQQLRGEVQKPFDHNSPEFTLEKIIEIGLDQYSELIGEISGAASKELAIEQAIQGIESSWKDLALDIAPYKDRGHFKLRSTEEMFQMLEDNQVTLSTMKASRYMKAFEKEIDKWERTLSHILEVVEMLLQVQRQWMYLENIFIGEDIRKQLPKESTDFDSVNKNWKTIMTRLHNDPNALRGTHYEGLLELLNEMNEILESIQRSLDMYLETKRQCFPRFYFLSNDDLLEILGQSKNPEAVQPHLKKCFDNIKSLDISKMKDHVEGTHMNSADGEKVEFKNIIRLEGVIEGWLCSLEAMMQATLKDVLRACRLDLKKYLTKRDKWIGNWPGQMLITASQIQWTGDCEKALDRGDKKGLKSMRKKQVAMLDKFSEAIRGNLTKLQRLKLVALVTIEVHSRDIIEKMLKSGITSHNAFEWQSQLRLYWEEDDCVIRQVLAHFNYGYEYLGNSGRLVITPLTDRCYMTLTTALHLHRGGSPKGPAGTGKTETVKDLGKSLGMYVIVINCSEGLDYKSMGRMFSGLAQSGAWGCFDEFNRINIEVLSVVAQQILSILQAMSNGAKRFVFEGREIRLNHSCGVFITMNPGYAGRTELPDNLKSMFRPIAMIVPDSSMIAEIILFGEGFSQTKVLARKVNTLYSLAVQQLSKQDHYDFGLRALVSVLKYGGKKKRLNPDMPDEEVLLLAMKDMNLAKLTAADLPLFNGVTSDLFPGVEVPHLDYSIMKAAIEKELKTANLQPIEITYTKIIQLYETKNSRHSVMIVGRSGSGKSVTWQMLRNTLSRLKKENPGLQYQVVKDFPINPKALSLGELYGEFNLSTSEWTDGVLSAVMRQACADDKPDEKWLVFDGPVDTLWIESMNSVMDDNKVLTLINGERIAMPEQVSLLFEVEDLAVASPATVSRCGMVYNDCKDLGWKPFVASWLASRQDTKSVELLQPLFDKFVEKTLQFRQKNCKELIPAGELNSVMSLCYLFDALATPANGVDPNDPDGYGRMVELWFLFCLLWSVCASVDEDGRRLMDNFIREIEGQFPAKDTVYEYYVDVKNRTWVHWEEKLKGAWRYLNNAPFYKIMVPTVDTVRYDFLVYNLILSERPVLLVGPVGTGKTSVAQGVVQKLDSSEYSLLTINLSSQTTSNNVQEIIENKVEKRTKGVYVPIGGKKLLTFMDDFNMPAKDTFGSQPPLELIRQWIDYGFFYDRQRQVIKQIKGMFLLAAMGPPGGGRMVISRRLQSRFNLINMTFPQESQIKRIFGTMISQKLQDFEEEVKALGDVMTQATIDIYNFVSTRMLPTPAKIHYLFNLRDISKVFQGLLRAHKHFHDTKSAIARLWVHECYRVFSDRLVGEKDHETFLNLLSEKLASHFDLTYHNLCPNKQPPLFVDFMRPDASVYEDILKFPDLKKLTEEKLEDYNMEPGVIPMSLVLFRDAIEHVCRIIRVIRQPRGNMMLIGVGGSGRQSLTRLAAYIIEYGVFQIEVTRHYRLQEFREDIRKLYFKAAVDNKPTVFLFTDTQVVEESFLEDINNILSSGEVPNLYKPDEFEEVRTALSESAKKDGISDSPDTMFAYFIERVRSNLHIVLCMSPVGDPFRNRIRMFPAFVNCTTIDWFAEWPRDALMEVAQRCLEEVNLGVTENLDTLRQNLSTIFVTCHRSVVDMSERMMTEMKRKNYVTPTNYLELVSGYKQLLDNKRRELGDAASKLRNGLSKLIETREKVEAMTVELEGTKLKLAQFQKECDEYLVNIVQQKRDAEEQEKAVQARSEKIAEDEQKCLQMQEAAEKDLNEALPALNNAIEALKSLNKKDLAEVKAYNNPPEQVETVMQAVMILKQSEPSWAEAKRQLGEPNFIKQLIEFDRNNMSDKTLKRIGQYCAKPDFKPDIVGRVSLAAKSLCSWVIAMETYGRIFRVVEPKQKKLEDAKTKLAEKQASLAEAKAKQREVKEKLEKLQKDYEEKLATKEELRKKAELTELRLDRAAKLVSGLAGERVRWEQSVKQLEKDMGFLVGDCLVASAFLSYAGPFLSNYRDELVQETWLKQVRELSIPCSPDFTFAKFLANPSLVRQWNIQGLPSDSFSTENGTIVTTSNRWPLMIDPQGQAIKWIKNMEKGRKLKIIDLQQPDFLRTLENAVQFGTPVLLQNIQEELDPSLAPILNKSVVKQGNRLIIRLGDKEVEFNPEFKFYITTKLSNPHYTPEISTKTAIVNFAVKEQGLEAQLLGIVVRKERPELEESKDKLVVNIAESKKKLKDLEDEILRLLNTAQGSLLDDEALVNALQSSKKTAEEVTEKLQTSEQTEIKIDAAREGYRPCAQRASILFFVMNDMGRIDPMYQFSLDSYIELFSNSIDKSLKHPRLEERIQYLNDYHTYAVYQYTCRGLFEKHKLLFSFQMCAKILEASGKLNLDEYNFFLRGGVVLDREAQMDNPCKWLDDVAWDNITELDKLASFMGIANSFDQYPRDWYQWFTSAEPENTTLPGEWGNSCNELQRMLIVRSMRPDRVPFTVTTFIVNNLGAKFVEPPVLNMATVLEDSACRIPLIFVLSPGVDPTSALLQLASQSGMGERFQALSLGQGQAPIAKKMIETGVKEGHWVFLANCHLSLSWMPQLDKLLEEELQIKQPHPDFRLWLSSTPHPGFPISILQAGIKMTTEPPKGLKANMKRLYQLIDEQTFPRCHAEEKYKRLLFSLCFFHSLLLERRKFLMLGWNINYGFNDSDYEVSEHLLSIYLDEYQDTPWDALKYLIAGVNYGGHVTDDWDRKVLYTYINDLFKNEVLTTPFFKLSSLPTYYIPKDGSLQSYKDHVAQLPAVDHPEAFGQHPNADIASQIKETRTLLDTLVSLQPQRSANQGESREDKVLNLASDVLKHIPALIDYDAAAKLIADDMNPLNVVLLQEIQRYNALLGVIRTSLIDLEKGIKGLVVMSSDLEEVFTRIYNAQVPKLWSKAYPSMKPLGSWTRDLVQRVEQFSKWAESTHPPVLFWLSGFTFPTGFLTAVLQTAARRNNVSIDSLSWEFHVSTLDDSNLTEAPKDGVWVKGLYLEGAGWDKKASCLIEANPMELVCPVPTIHFKPTESKKKSTKGIYSCPVYYYPNRAGNSDRASFVVAADIKSGQMPAEHWVKRGTALLMSLDH